MSLTLKTQEMSMFRRLGTVLRGIFQNRRNLYDVFNYTYAPTFDHFMTKYIRQDLAARVIDAPAAALWTNPPQVTSNMPEWDLAWQDLVARHSLYSMLEKIDKLAGIGRYSVLIIGFNDGKTLDQPVNAQTLGRNKEKILFLQPYSEKCAEITLLDENPTSKNFLKPLMYKISPSWDDAAQNSTASLKARTSFQVHASRVLHIAENTLENELYGYPRMERVYNILDDIQKVTGGTAETFWLTANRGLHVDVDKEMELEPDDAKDLSDEMDEYSNGLRRIIRTRGVKVNSLGSDVPDPRGSFDILIATLSGATGIPRRILTGSEAGQLASEQDRANWADRIDERRANWANPSVIFPLMRKLTAAGYLPMNDSLNITVKWLSAFKMSPLEAAQTAAQHARSTTNFAKAIQTMSDLNRGTPGAPEVTDAEGKVVSAAVMEVPGAGLDELISIEEARAFIGLDKPQVTFNSGDDVKTVQP